MFVGKKKAFSLIEMMLIIVIISVIALYAANIARQRAQAALATKTAAEMQQWLQAAANYYTNNNGQWPSTSGNGSSSTDSGFSVLNSANLLPSTLQCSALLASSSTASCGLYSPFYLSYPDSGDTAKNAPYIQINLQVPQAALGKSIAAKLVAATYDNGVVTAAGMPRVGRNVPYYGANLVLNTAVSGCGVAAGWWPVDDDKYSNPILTVVFGAQYGCFLFQYNIVQVPAEFGTSYQVYTNNTFTLQENNRTTNGPFLPASSPNLYSIDSVQRNYPGSQEND